ncbi:uncharacterized protein C8R40DRAFT_1170895 [Lentinula edodes]|uniref:uncharacterized protein n=1 Tax=Lentinula edodes TaxID=5353 RepID=UPI001E8CC588|nr:uncharacterized protein C8R40DRAFT_1170895 [Lentinula edodes]KAH7875284.1 hypothetical protein C8R40DRAFT_1170895 [Lentinula edodes]
MAFFEADFDFFDFFSPRYRPIFSRAYYCAYGQHHHHHHHHYPYSPLPPFPTYSPYSPYSPLPPTRVTPPVIPPLPLARPQSADQDYWTGSPRARTILTPAALRPNNQSKPKKVKPKREKELYVAPVRPPLPAPPHNVWFYSTPPPASPWAPAPYAWTTTISTPGSGYAVHVELKPE